MAGKIPVDASTSRTDLLTWEASLSMLDNVVLFKQLALALGVGSFSVVCLLTALRAFERDLTWEQLGNHILVGSAMFVGLLLLSVVAILLFYGNRYQYRFTVDEQGIEAVTVSRTRKWNQMINFLVVLSGRPTAMGAGLLAETRQSQTVRWADVDNLAANPPKREIALRKGRRTIMLVQCTAENYERVLSRVNQSLKR